MTIQASYKIFGTEHTASHQVIDNPDVRVSAQADLTTVTVTYPETKRSFQLYFPAPATITLLHAQRCTCGEGDTPDLAHCEGCALYHR